MWFLGEPMFNYLRDRRLGQKIADMILVIAAFTWIAATYIVATNYEVLKQALFTKSIDMKGLVQLDKSLNEILSTTMLDIGSDRASLSRFHNSILDLQQRHFVYESRSNEVVQPGVSLVAQLRQNLLLSMINIWAQSFVKGECVYMTGVAQTDQFYEFYRQIGTKADIKCPVYNTSGLLVGYLNFEYTTRTMTTAEMKTKEGKVRDAAAKIGAILSITLGTK